MGHFALIVFLASAAPSAGQDAAVRFSTPDPDAGYAVEVRQRDQSSRCAAEIRKEAPCLLQLSPGKADVRVEGTASGGGSIVLPAGPSEVAVYRMRRIGEEGPMLGMGLFGLGILVALPLVSLGVATDTSGLWIAGAAVAGTGLGLGVLAMALSHGPKEFAAVSDPVPPGGTRPSWRGPGLRLSF